MKKKVVIVSVPMKGKDDALIERSIQLAKVQYCKIRGVTANDIEFLDGFHDGYCRMDNEAKEFVNKLKNPAVFYLAHSIELMVNAYEVIFGQGWDDDRECKIESQVAHYYGIPSIKMTKKTSEEILENMENKNKEKVRKLWKEDKFSIKEIAERTKFPESTICKWCEKIDKE